MKKQKLPEGEVSWKQWRTERKQIYRKWKEEKLLKKLDKQKKNTEEKKKLNSISTEEKPEGQGRAYTVSVAVPGSILDNAQSPDLRTYLAGQIARACAVFSVDEIVIFDDYGSTRSETATTEGEFSGIGKRGHAVVQMARILQFLECPQYLRKQLFPIHKDLEYAGLLNPLDAPHHLRVSDISEYREGITRNQAKEGKGSLVNVGLQKDALIDKMLLPGVRVTVKLDLTTAGLKHIRGTAVAPSAPRTESGLYWGYTVRLAQSLGAVLSECPFKDGYDLTIGTSDKGDNVDTVSLPKFKHALIVFGGLNGLEASLEADEALDIDDPSYLFSFYLNTCPVQGSRTIRTEEAVLISLASLRPKIQLAQQSNITA